MALPCQVEDDDPELGIFKDRMVLRFLFAHTLDQKRDDTGNAHKEHGLNGNGGQPHEVGIPEHVPDDLICAGADGRDDEPALREHVHRIDDGDKEESGW